MGGAVVSAFLVSPFHINVLVTWAGMARGSMQRGYYWQGRRRYFAGDLERIASVLFAENVRSVNRRYRQADPAHGFTFRPEHAAALRCGPVQIIKACHCLAYQSCETDDWDETEAAAILRGIEESAVRSLPGYDAAAWELRP